MHHHLRPFSIQGATVFAREVAKQGTMTDFHIVAVDDTQGTAVLVVVKGGFAVLEAAVIQFACTGFFHADAIPATTTHVEEVKPCSVGYSEEDGIVFRSKGVQQGAIFDTDSIETIEYYGGSGFDVQGFLNNDIARNENGISFPNT